MKASWATIARRDTLSHRETLALRMTEWLIRAGLTIPEAKQQALSFANSSLDPQTDLSMMRQIEQGIPEGLGAWRAGEGRRLVVQQIVRNTDRLLATIDARDAELAEAVRLLRVWTYQDVCAGCIQKGSLMSPDFIGAGHDVGCPVVTFLARHPSPDLSPVPEEAEK